MKKVYHHKDKNQGWFRNMCQSRSLEHLDTRYRVFRRILRDVLDLLDLLAFLPFLDLLAFLDLLDLLAFLEDAFIDWRF